MDSHTFWKNLTMYNENVLKWCGAMYSDEDIDLLIDTYEDDIIVYDDSEEWYNNDGEQRSQAVLVGLISQRSWVRIPLPLLRWIGG